MTTFESPRSRQYAAGEYSRSLGAYFRARSIERIASKLEELGYYTYIIKEQPDKAGESVIQKVLRYACHQNSC